MTIPEQLEEYKDLSLEHFDRITEDRPPFLFWILVPVYNFEAYLKDCLESILSQTIRDRVRILIFNDGSTDNSGTIIREFSEANREVIYANCNTNRGPAFSKWAGIEILKEIVCPNDIFGIVDGDDMLLGKNALRIILEKYISSSCWVTYGNQHDGIKTRNFDPTKPFNQQEWCYAHPRTCRAFLLKHILKEHFLFSDGTFLRKGTDRALIYNLCCLSGPKRVQFIQEPIYFYRIHPMNTLRVVPSNICDKQKAYQQKRSYPKQIEFEDKDRDEVDSDMRDFLEQPPVNAKLPPKPDPEPKRPDLSFCITCMNRLGQISQTLRKNLDDNRDDREKIEFIVLDLGSTDGVSQWVMENFVGDLASGYLKLFFSQALDGKWHAPIAKNTAHRLATGKILVNLDCDNFTGFQGARYLIERFGKTKNVFLHQTAGYMTGTAGRIVTRREDFFRLGGYDQSFEPMGYQDVDLVERLSASGVVKMTYEDLSYSTAIQNTKEESMKYCGGTSWKEMNIRNKKRSQENVAGGKLVANKGGNVGIEPSKIRRLRETDLPPIKVSFNEKIPVTSEQKPKPKPVEKKSATCVPDLKEETPRRERVIIISPFYSKKLLVSEAYEILLHVFDGNTERPTRENVITHPKKISLASLKPMSDYPIVISDPSRAVENLPEFVYKHRLEERLVEVDENGESLSHKSFVRFPALGVVDAKLLV